MFIIQKLEFLIQLTSPKSHLKNMIFHLKDYLFVGNVTLPETSIFALKIGHPKRKQSYSNHPFSGAKC